MSDFKFLSGSFSDAGRRTANEDCIFLSPEHGIYLVCDGTGGSIGGRRAAELICDTIARRAAQIIASMQNSIEEGKSIIEESFREAHRLISKQQLADPSLSKMSSTAVMIAIQGKDVIVAHIGDSRAYLHRNDDLLQLTIDHSLENHLKEHPEQEQQRKLPGKTLVQALGLKTEHLKIDQSHFDLLDNDVLFLCSDGLTDAVPAWALREIAKGARDENPKEIATSAGRAALRYGSMDNTSIIVISIKANLTPSVIATGAVSQEPPKERGWLAFLDGNQADDVITLSESTLIGANPDCPIYLDDGYVSWEHVEIYLNPSKGFILKDLKSTNGTFVNNTKLNLGQEIHLVDDDILKIGTTELKFKSYRVN